MFDRILIPEGVHRELKSPAPNSIQRFVAAAPSWLEVHVAPPNDPTLGHLDSGEREVIALASSLMPRPCCSMNTRGAMPLAQPA